MIQQTILDALRIKQKVVGHGNIIQQEIIADRGYARLPDCVNEKDYHKELSECNY